MNNIIEIQAAEFHATIDLEKLPILPLNKIRKLFRLIFMTRFDDNSEAIQTITDRLPEMIAEAKENWRRASKNYADHCHTTDARGYPIPSARQGTLDRPLISEVKKTKATFERMSKIQIMFQEIQNKEKKLCIKTTP
jgi:hypothetical protein